MTVMLLPRSTGAQRDQAAGPSRDPEEPAAHVSDYLALLPSGPDAVRRLKLHRVRAALRPVTEWRPRDATMTDRRCPSLSPVWGPIKRCRAQSLG